MRGKKRFFIETFGCQMNVNDSEKVAGLLTAEGYEATDSPSQADVVFVNTCAVRERAADKLFHALGRLRGLKARRPGLVIGVGGCVAQLEGKSILDRAPHVDVLVGTHNVARVPELVNRAEEGLGPLVDLDRRADSFQVPTSVVAHSSPVRAYVTIMEGCNHVCSFCVVPRTRGPEVCRHPEDIVSEVRSLVDRGYPEVMLLGQTVNAYRYGETDFATLLALVHDVPGLLRLRFTTSHPEHVGMPMANAFRDLPRLCPYLHLPFQSGSDRILEAMRRGYDRRQYLETISLLRSRRPDLALSSDVIVGYPGETDEDFRATVDLVDQVGLEGLFVFAYSPRPGTTAYRVRDSVPESEKKQRLRILNERQQWNQAMRNDSQVGGLEEVLVEAVSGESRLSGRTSHFRIVHFDGPARLLGRLTKVRITGAGRNSLQGRIDASNALTVSSAVPIF